MLPRLILIATLITLAGCATTKIETPFGMAYESNRDSQLDKLYYEHTVAPDGTETTIWEVNGARGKASSVIDAQTDFLRAAVEAAFAAGLRGAVPGG